MGYNLVIDLDGTLAEWGEDHAKCGEWMDGAQSFVRDAILVGHTVIVHSCRATWKEGGGWESIARFLATGAFCPYLVTSEGLAQGQRWEEIEVMARRDLFAISRGGMPPEGPHIIFEGEAPPLSDQRVGIWVGTGKPLGHFYIDDRGLSFDPDKQGWDTFRRQFISPA